MADAPPVNTESKEERLKRLAADAEARRKQRFKGQQVLVDTTKLTVQSPRSSDIAEGIAAAITGPQESMAATEEPQAAQKETPKFPETIKPSAQSQTGGIHAGEFGEYTFEQPTKSQMQSQTGGIGAGEVDPQLGGIGAGEVDPELVGNAECGYAYKSPRSGASPIVGSKASDAGQSTVAEMSFEGVAPAEPAVVATEKPEDEKNVSIAAAVQEHITSAPPEPKQTAEVPEPADMQTRVKKLEESIEYVNNELFGEFDENGDIKTLGLKYRVEDLENAPQKTGSVEAAPGLETRTDNIDAVRTELENRINDVKSDVDAIGEDVAGKFEGDKLVAPGLKYRVGALENAPKPITQGDLKNLKDDILKKFDELMSQLFGKTPEERKAALSVFGGEPVIPYLTNTVTLALEESNALTAEKTRDPLVILLLNNGDVSEVVTRYGAAPIRHILESFTRDPVNVREALISVYGLATPDEIAKQKDSLDKKTAEVRQRASKALADFDNIVAKAASNAGGA